MKIAIIEMANSHDECIYSQIKIIKSIDDIHLSLICDLAIEERAKYFELVDNKVFVQIRKGIKKWIDLYKIWRFCRKERFDKIIFNTAQGGLASNFLRFPFDEKTKFYGILHDVRKVTNSRSQRIISKKVKHYFILNDYLKKHIENVKFKKLSFSVFYPISFAKYNWRKVNKLANEIWVCVPGQVELKRRDYEILFDSIQEHGINENIKFLLLGRCNHKYGDGDHIKHLINKLYVQNNFMLWDDFISVDVFHTMVKNSDIIFPLIHKEHESGSLYEKQISGSYNLAVGYKKPMLIEKKYQQRFVDYEVIPYEKDSLMKTINLLDKKYLNGSYNHEKWTFEFQKRTYLNSLGITDFV